jgi:hypothetical protein
MLCCLAWTTRRPGVNKSAHQRLAHLRHLLERGWYGRRGVNTERSWVDGFANNAFVLAQLARQERLANQARGNIIPPPRSTDHRHRKTATQSVGDGGISANVVRPFGQTFINFCNPKHYTLESNVLDAVCLCARHASAIPIMLRINGRLGHCIPLAVVVIPVIRGISTMTPRLRINSGSSYLVVQRWFI